MSDTRHAVTIVEHAPPTTGLHPLVQIMQTAVSAGGPPDVALLREMMQLQRDWEANEARKAYTKALVALKQDLPAVINKDHLVDFGEGSKRVTYRHTTLAGMMDAITGPLARHGFALTYTTNNADNGKVSVTAVLTHADGHSEGHTLTAPNDSGSGRSTIQGIASSITYLQRYTALALLGIATADMNEPEPTNEDPDRIDPDANLRAVGLLATKGIAKDAAEEFLGRKVQAWTVADRAKIGPWVKRQLGQGGE